MKAPMNSGRWTALALSFVAWAASADEDCDDTAERTAEVRLDGIDRIVIDASAGTLTVLGSAEQKTASAHGIACASSKSILEQIQIRTRTSGRIAYITAEVPTHLWNPFDWASGESMALDLTVRVPARLAVEVKDTSGAIEIRGTGDIEIEDGSGSITAQDIHGDIEIDDGSGPLLVENVRGDVDVEDGSGSLRIRQVGGDVTVEDGSGSIDISEVQRDIVIQRDGSGSISVTDVGGSFTVEHDGSGGVSHRGVKGKILVDD